jgi:hypothetical protein
VIRSWRHRDGGRVVQIGGDRWLLEAVVSPHHRNQHGVHEPFSATLKLWPREEQEEREEGALAA